jgi:hypothetical protein
MDPWIHNILDNKGESQSTNRLLQPIDRYVHHIIFKNITAALTLESCYAYLSWSSGTARDAVALIRMTVLTAKQMHDRFAYARRMHIYSHYIRQDSDSLDPSRRCRTGPMICKE